jgi:hypothetical protein
MDSIAAAAACRFNPARIKPVAESDAIEIVLSTLVAAVFCMISGEMIHAERMPMELQGLEPRGCGFEPRQLD